MHVVAIDRRTSARLRMQEPRVSRPALLRRVISLPGNNGMERPELAPTPLPPHEPHKPIEIVDAPVTSRWEVLMVVRLFTAVAVRLLWWRVIGRSHPARTGRALRDVFERLGGLWMKVGQLMSLRRDVLPAQLCDELAHLQNRAIGFPSKIAIGVIETALGRPLEEIFSEFDPHPFAAASLSQVHAARLRSNNADVVVKVLRPGIREKFERDLSILRFIAKRLNRMPSLRIFRLRDALGEFEQIFNEETDYRYEITNMREMRKTTRGHGIYIPRVYHRLSTSNVIVMERISGVLMSDYIQMRDRDPDAVKHWLEENNIRPRKVGSRLLVSFMRQLFETNLFHADLHPGNIILLRNSRVALIDLGSVGSLDREFLTLYRGVQRALADNDFGKAADLQLRLCAQLPPRNVPELRMELARCLRVWSTKTKVKQLPFHERSVNSGAAEVSRILYRYGAQQTWEFLKIARTLSTLDASLQYLYGGLDYIRVLQDYFQTASGRAIRQALRPASLSARIGAVVATIDEYHLMLGPVMRSSAFNFEATVSKVSRVFALVMKVVSGVVLLGTIAVIYKFMQKHAGNLHDRLQNPIMDKVAHLMPDLEIFWWSVVILVCAGTLIATRRILKVLTTPEAGNKR